LKALGGERAVDSVELAGTLDVLAESLWRTSRAYEPDARNAAQHALRIKEKLLGPDALELISSLNNLGNIAFQLGEYSTARQLFERTLAMRRKLLGSDHLDVSKSLNNLGGVGLRTGDFDGSRRYYEESLAIREKKLPPDDPALADGLNNLAQLLQRMGSFSEARRLYERALSIRENSSQSKNFQIADSLDNLANLLYDTGDYAEAKPLYERALAIREKDSGGQNNVKIADSLNNLGNLFMAMNDFDAAKPCLERALKIRQEAYGGEHEDVASSLQNLANFYKDTGDFEAARPLYEQALRMRENLLGADDADLSGSLSSLAYIDWREGNLSQARIRFARAVAVTQRALGTRHPDVGLNLVGLADFLARTAQRGEAMSIALRAEEIGREHMRLTSKTLSERQALRYAAVRSSGLDIALSLAGDRLDSASITRVWDSLIRSRALVLDEMASRTRSLSTAQDSQTRRLTDALAAARKELANLTLRGRLAEESAEGYVALLEQARRKKERSEHDLAERSAAFRQQVKEQEADVRTVTNGLPPESCLVAYVLYARLSASDENRSGRSPSKDSNPESAAKPDSIPSYMALVYCTEKPGLPRAVSLGSAAEVDELAFRWSEEASGRASRSEDSPDAAEKSYRRAGESFRKRLWDPLRVSSARRVFIVPDGALALVSFSTLPVGQSGYLVESAPVIHYLSAERDLVLPDLPQKIGFGLLALGEPAYDDPTMFASLSAPGKGGNLQSSPSPFATRTALGKKFIPGDRADAPESMRRAAPSCDDFRKARFDPLPASGKESGDIARLWKQLDHAGRPSSQAVVLQGARASETAFKKAAPGKDTLHLATHGFFLGGSCESGLAGSRGIGGLAARQVPPSKEQSPDNPLLLSGLVLAGANHRDRAGPGEEDGILTAEEIAGMNLSGVRWTVLSACDTGIGKVQAGEGVFGLRRAFAIAGVRTVIMSLWSVRDVETWDWMRRLYTNRLKGLSTADAVRQASVDVINQRRKEGLDTHPSHWGGFVAAGDWR
jgi:tetratricopeptide (TPR) repeat protein/CHAT domain-containing protein